MHLILSFPSHPFVIRKQNIPHQAVAMFTRHLERRSRLGRACEVRSSQASQMTLHTSHSALTTRREHTHRRARGQRHTRPTHTRTRVYVCPHTCAHTRTRGHYDSRAHTYTHVTRAASSIRETSRPVPARLGSVPARLGPARGTVPRVARLDR